MFNRSVKSYVRAEGRSPQPPPDPRPCLHISAASHPASNEDERLVYGFAGISIPSELCDCARDLVDNLLQASGRDEKGLRHYTVFVGDLVRNEGLLGKTIDKLATLGIITRVCSDAQSTSWALSDGARHTLKLVIRLRSPKHALAVRTDVSVAELTALEVAMRTTCTRTERPYEALL